MKTYFQKVNSLEYQLSITMPRKSVRSPRKSIGKREKQSPIYQMQVPDPLRFQNYDEIDFWGMGKTRYNTKDDQFSPDD